MDKFKIPTILGLGIIFIGLVSGLFLVLKEQVFLSQAAPDLTPQNITFSNLTEESVVVSWQTNSQAASFITFGQSNPGEQTALDDRDINSPKPRLTHYVTLKNLLPQTRYQFKIISGKTSSEVTAFETARPLINQTGFTPIIGSVLDDTAPLDDGIVYLSVSGTTTQSALVKTGGNFLIPLAKLRRSDLSDIYLLSENTIAKLTILSDKGTASLLFNLESSSSPLSPVKLGQNIDLTAEEATPQKDPETSDLDKFDLNTDGKVNATDYALTSSCVGKKPNTVLPEGRSCNKADINKDGKINQQDLDLISQKLRT